MDLNEAENLLRSLNNYVASLRDAFEDFEEKGKIKLIGLKNEPVYKEDIQRKKQRSVKLSRNDDNSEDTPFSGRKIFRVTVFLPMMNYLLTAFQKRLEVYDGPLENTVFLPMINCLLTAFQKRLDDAVSGKFGFLSCPK